MKLSKEAQIGIVSIVALGCFIYGFNYLKGINYFSSENRFYAVYKDIDGLVEANPLIINGYKVGIVSKIVLNNNAQRDLTVTLLLDEDIKVPVNSVAEVVNSDLLGSKAVNLRLGDAITFCENGDTIKAANAASLMATVNEAILPLQNKAENLISSVDSVLKIVQAVLNPQTQAELSKSIHNATLALASIQRTSDNMDGLVESEKVKISNIITNINTLSKSLANNSDNLDHLMESADSTLQQTTSIMNKINNGTGTIGKLVNNDSLYTHLDQSSEDLDKLLIDLRKNPKRYVHFSIFSRKEKE